MALPSSDRQNARIIWVVLHTAEGARRASDLYAYFDRNQNSSSHVGIDASGFYDWIPRLRYSWTLLSGNRISVNAELCAFAHWTRDQWLSTDVVDGCVNPRAIVRNAALWAKRECETLGIPKTHIGVAGVRARAAGIIDHDDYSDGTGDGDHHDVGENFPWDVFFADMNGDEDDMQPSDNVTVVSPAARQRGDSAPWKQNVPVHELLGDTWYYVTDLFNLVVPRMEARQEAILAAVQATTSDPDITVDALRQIVNDAVQQHVQITGTVQIGSTKSTT
jgi:hypothetical protein